jgi:PAS domain S-box-containing protein
VHELWHGQRAAYELEKRYVRKDGELAWVLLSVSAVQEAGGATRHVIAQVQDITERRAADAARRIQDLRYRAIAEATSDLIVLTDLTGVVEYLSPSAARYGWRPDDIVGQRFIDRLHPEDIAGVEAGARRLLKSGGLDRLRWRARRGDNGEWRWFESHATVLRGEEGAEAKILDVVRDIHDQVKAARRNAAARAAAEEAVKVKSQFLANISHEIRTPLTAVLGFADVLRRRSDLPSDAADEIERIHVAGRGLLALVNDVIDFSQLEADQFVVRPRPTRLTDLTDEVIAVFSEAARAKDLSLSAAIDPTLPDVCSLDPDRVRQMLFNLVGNAIKFTSHGGVDLRILAHDRPDWIHFEVADSGPGIPREMQPQLFRRFSQVDGARNRGHGGAGLGLAITRGIVETMGGEVTLQSAPGLGSTFRLGFPAPACSREEESATAGKLPSIAAARVLVVDDNPVNRMVAEKLLAVLGVSVVAVESGEQALDVLSRAVFDVVLMDIRMPLMDGPETLYRLRSTPGPNQATQVVAFTADTERDEGAFARFDGLLGKPIDAAAMAACIAQVLARGRTGMRGSRRSAGRPASCDKFGQSAEPSGGAGFRAPA